MKKTLILQAPAKINIALWVKEKRPDGFHEIESVMQTITLSDTITLQETKESGIQIECDNPAVPTDDGNICHKAACTVLQHFNISPRLYIRIQKRIPVAAGLAGGSTDAAAVMFGLVRMYDKALPLPDLMTLSQNIGSDVPFVMHGGLALATGRGENLSFFDSPKPPFVALIAVPKGVEVATKWAYGNYHPGENRRKSERFAEVLAAFKHRELKVLREKAFNDLETVTFQAHPEVARIKELLAAEDHGFVLMSGSGPSVFGLFEDKRSAAQAAARLDPEKVDVFLEHTLRNAGR